MPHREQPPSILLDEISDMKMRGRVRILDAHIHDKPLLFTGLLVHDDEVREMLGNSTQRDLRADAVRQTGRSPQALLREYFTNNFDRFVEFDPETERAIGEDPAHQALLGAVRSAKTFMVKEGVMKSAMRSHIEAPALRDQARVNRLGLYVGQVAAYKAEQGAIALPSAG
jgi:hypothetical protein